MSRAMMRCNLCESSREPYRTPHDEIGVALMWAHLRADHGVEPPDEFVVEDTVVDASSALLLRPAEPTDYTWATGEAPS